MAERFCFGRLHTIHYWPANRFKEVREHLALTQQELANRLGFKQYKIKDIETEKQKVSSEIAESMEKLFSISGWWLLTGKGQMLFTDEDKSSTASNNHGYEIDMLNVKLGAGEGIYNYEVQVIDKIVMDKAFFKTAPNINKIKIIEVDGDSMEPTLYNGDFIIIDETKTNKIDGIYAIQLDGQLLVKRLEFNLDNTITIISDNSRYSSKVYDPNETQIPFHLIGMKTLSIQR